MGLSNAQPLAQARDPCFQILACVLTSWFAPTRQVGCQLAHDEGLGRLRHVQTRHLSVQQRIKEGDLRLKTEPGDTNVSDALTKPLDEKRMTNLLTMMGYAFRRGRTALAPEAQ